MAISTNKNCGNLSFNSPWSFAVFSKNVVFNPKSAQPTIAQRLHDAHLFLVIFSDFSVISLTFSDYNRDSLFLHISSTNFQGCGGKNLVSWLFDMSLNNLIKMLLLCIISYCALWVTHLCTHTVLSRIFNIF